MRALQLRRMAGLLLAVLVAGCSPGVVGYPQGTSATVVGSQPPGQNPVPGQTPVTGQAPALTPAAPPSSARPAPPSTPAESASSGPPAGALGGLAALEVKGRAPKTGYTRDQFGQAWSDDVTVSGGHNGCDQRSDVLRRDLLDMVLKPNTQGCVPASGTLRDPFTGHQIAFVRGATTSAQVQIDHLVPLSNAWQTGAQQLSEEQRQNLAGDPLELLAVDGSSNQSKGDGDAATWLPPDKSFRCTYVARQIAVKVKYGLWVTPPEKTAMQNVLADCPGEPLPSDDGSGVVVPAPQR